MSESLLTAGTEPTDAAPTTTVATTTDAAATVATTDAAATTPAADKPATEAEGKPADDKPVVEGAPEKYADFTAPEGATLAPELVAEVGTLAKELNLSQDKAQKVVELASKLASQGTSAVTAEIKTVNDGWIAATKVDAEFGGDKLAASLATAKAAMEATCTPQLRMLLDRSGLGNNAEVIRHFLKIAPAFAEDKHVTGGKAPVGDRSAAKVLYPNAA